MKVENTAVTVFAVDSYGNVSANNATIQITYVLSRCMLLTVIVTFLPTMPRYKSRMFFLGVCC